MGPSLKNVDFKISEEKFVKWGEKVPKSFYDLLNKATTYILLHIVAN